MKKDEKIKLIFETATKLVSQIRFVEEQDIKEAAKISKHLFDEVEILCKDEEIKIPFSRPTLRVDSLTR